MKSILVFGDSLVFGRGDITFRGGWVFYIKRRIEKKEGYWCVFNLGIPSDSLTEIKNRIKQEALSRFKRKYPDDELFIIVAGSVNDTIINKSESCFAKTVAELIKDSLLLTKKFIIIGILPVDEERQKDFFGKRIFSNKLIWKYERIIQKVAEEKDINFLPLFQWGKNNLNAEDYYIDGVHLSNFGYRKLGRKIYKFLTQKFPLLR